MFNLSGVASTVTKDAIFQTMKKFLFAMILLGGAVAFTSCEKENKGNGETGEITSVTDAAGNVYKVVKLADGNYWMAENLRYIPEGKTVSEDPAKGDIWYPYDPETSAATTDTEKVKQLGLLYNASAAFGIEITENSANTVKEGTQGICPEGWHIPTFTEILNLVGNCSKISVKIGDFEANTAPENKNAIFYDEAYEGGKISDINKSGFNFTFSGTRNGGNAKYMAGNKGYEKTPMTYCWSSTFYKNIYSKTQKYSNSQYFALMSNVNSKYPEGRLTVAFNSHYNGSPVRCVKDKAAE